MRKIKKLLLGISAILSLTSLAVACSFGDSSNSVTSTSLAQSSSSSASQSSSFQESSSAESSSASSSSESSDTHEHNYVSSVTKEATCTKTGTTTYTCECGKSYTEEIPVLEHDVVQLDFKSATCVSEGWYDYEYCKRDGCTYTTKISIPVNANAHDFVHHDGQDPTCTKDGYHAYETCSLCDFSTYRVAEALGHRESSATEENRVEPTCSTNGSYDVVIRCTVCKEETYRGHFELVTIAHTAQAPVEENRVEATCSAEGSYDYVTYCSVCETELSRSHMTIPLKTHTPADAVKENVVEPIYGYNQTGTDGSYDDVIYCKDCKTLITKIHHTAKMTPQEYYSQYDYLELSATVNAPKNLIDNGDGTYLLYAKTNGGKSVRLLIEGEIGNVDGGWGSFGSSTKLYTLDALPGINFLDYEVVSAPQKDFTLLGYYNLNQQTSVDSPNELFNGGGGFIIGQNRTKADQEASMYPDYLCMNGFNVSLEIISLKIYYCNVMSTIDDIKLNTNLYTQSYSKSYLPGDWYDAAIERIPNGDDVFELFAFPLQILLNNPECLAGINTVYHDLLPITEDVHFGDIIDASGQVVNKNNRFLQSGDKIQVTIGNCTRNLELCTEPFQGEHLYEISPNTVINSIGTQKILVVPVTFNDQKDRIDNAWLASLRGMLGNVIDDDGNVTTYGLSNGTSSLSGFMSTSSYGKFTTQSYITEPYVIDGKGSEYYGIMMPNSIFDDIADWLSTLAIDNSAFDQNNDGYYDAVLLVNTLYYLDAGYDGYARMGMSGAFCYRYGSTAGTHEKPTINTYINVATLHLYETKDINEKNADASTLIHEFGHVLGLQDYYDDDNMKNTIGRFDMEAATVGDWNSYTKYLLGWIDPIVVDGTQDEVELTISAYSTHGDAIVVHALGHTPVGTPFDEYIILDLFAHDGLYEAGSAQFGLSESVGVRIYHVNSVYDMRISEAKDGTKTISAWPHHNVTSSSKYASQGKYLLEMIQNGNVNTFMGTEYGKTYVSAKDLFYTGDTFSVDEYDNFFYNGKMDNGMDFGYTITVKSIVENGADSTATIVISKKA